MQLTGIPVWACLGAQRMARVAIPDCVKELHVFADNDASFQSWRCAEELTCQPVDKASRIGMCFR